MNIKGLAVHWPLAFVCACIIAMLWPTLNADFSMIDDHEIVSILGRDSRVDGSELLPLMREWAVETTGRFRPGYYVERVVEAFIVGGNAGFWYANRLVLALVSAVALYVGLRTFLWPFYAGVVTLLFFSGPQNEIWTRLGPAETYGIPLTICGLAWIAVELRRHRSQPIQLLPGFALLLLAGFIKESFIPILPAALAFVYVVWPLVSSSRVTAVFRYGWQDSLLLAILIAGTAAQVWLTASMLRTYQHVYNAETSVASRFSAIIPLLLAYARDTLWFFPPAAAVAVALVSDRKERRSDGWQQHLLPAAVLLFAGVILLFLPQAVIYGGNVQIRGRYLAPGILFAVFTAAVGFYLLSKDALNNNLGEVRGVVAGVLVGVALVGILATNRDARIAALDSRRFQERLRRIVEVKARHPHLPLVFYSTNILDREPIMSVARYLAVKLPPDEQPFLQSYDWAKLADSPLKKRLAALLNDQSHRGDAYFAPIGELRTAGGECVALIFSGVADQQCRHVVQFGDK